MSRRDDLSRWMNELAGVAVGTAGGSSVDSPARPTTPERSEPRATDDAVEPDLRRSHVEMVVLLQQLLTLNGRSLDEPDPDPEAGRLGDVIKRAHALLVEHPIAARALFGAFAAEGRAFAQTTAGEELRGRLVASAEVRRGALLWNSLTMGLFDDQDPVVLPSVFLERLTELASDPELEETLDGLR